MTDLEITELCAKAIGHHLIEEDGGYEIGGEQLYILCGNPIGGYNRYRYDPLHDDAQAMALVKKFNLFVNWNSRKVCWVIPLEESPGSPADSDDHINLNRAICECVANMQRAKEKI